jgi:cobalt/nickel transport system permease protein
MLFNTRVALLTASSFGMISRVDLVRALAFSRTLTWLLVIAHSQIATQRRVLSDFLQALRSRTLGRLRLRDLHRHRAAASGGILKRGLHDATEVTLAMRSRGFSDD